MGFSACGYYGDFLTLNGDFLTHHGVFLTLDGCNPLKTFRARARNKKETRKKKNPRPKHAPPALPVGQESSRTTVPPESVRRSSETVEEVKGAASGAEG